MSDHISKQKSYHYQSLIPECNNLSCGLTDFNYEGLVKPVIKENDNNDDDVLIIPILPTAFKIKHKNIDIISKKSKNYLKIDLPLTDENDRANFMAPDQINHDTDDIEIPQKLQKELKEFNKVKRSLISHSNLTINKNKKQKSFYQPPRWKPMNQQIETRKYTNHKRPPMYRNKRENYFDDESFFNQSQDVKLKTCSEIPGLSSFNLWSPWKNKQEAYIAIDKFLGDLKQQVLENLK